MAVFPASIIAFTTKTNKVDLVDASHINTLQEEVVAIQTELGKDPAGTTTNVDTRLDVSIGENGGVRTGTTNPGSAVLGQMFFRTDSGAFQVWNGTTWVSAQSLSNVIYTWSGRYAASAKSIVYEGTSVNPTNAPGDNYRFIVLSGDVTTYATVLQGRWTKFSGVNTISVAAVIWVQAATQTANLQVDVGGATGAVTGTADQTTPQNVAIASIDVSGLVNGTSYDIKIQLKASTGAATSDIFLGAVVLTGS